MIHILNHKKLMFIIVYFFSYWIKIWPGLKQKKDCMVLFQIEDGYNFKGESELYTGIKICFFWHSQLDGSLKAFRADWIQGRPNIYKHTNILFFFFKWRCLVTDSVGWINVPLLDMHYVTLFGHCTMTLVLFCLYWMK